MALPIERWVRQALRRERKGDYSPVASTAILADIGELARLHKQTWKRRQIELIEAKVPVAMPEGTYGGLLNYPNAATITTTVATANTWNLWPQATYSAFPANLYLMPQAYRVAVVAKITTSASPGNMSFDPRIGQGTWTTGGTAITGTTLGAGTAIAMNASAVTNAFWTVMGDITVRSGGAPGANWTAVGMFHLVSTQGAAGVAGPGAVSINQLFGGTNASFDGTLAQGFGLGFVQTAAVSITNNVEQIHCMDWN